MPSNRMAAGVVACVGGSSVEYRQSITVTKTMDKQIFCFDTRLCGGANEALYLSWESSRIGLRRIHVVSNIRQKGQNIMTEVKMAPFTTECNDEATSVMFTDFPEIVSITQLGEMLNISKNSCYRLLNAGQIRYLRIGRKYLIPKQSILQYITEIMR